VSTYVQQPLSRLLKLKEMKPILKALLKFCCTTKNLLKSYFSNPLLGPNKVYLRLILRKGSGSTTTIALHKTKELGGEGEQYLPEYLPLVRI